MSPIVTVIRPLNGATLPAIQPGEERRAAKKVSAQVTKWAMRCWSESVRLAPLGPTTAKRVGGRLRGGLWFKPLDPTDMAWKIGTNVRSDPSPSWPQGYFYPLQQEFQEAFLHPRGGTWGYLRKPVKEAAPQIEADCVRAYLSAFDEINAQMFPGKK